jgi:hypothetical protein
VASARPVGEHVRVTELLDGVDEIDWPALDHAYGSAEQVPGWLAAMTDQATAVEALGDLDVAVYHQGGAVYSAGAAVVPFLIRFALDPVVSVRTDVLDLICRFAALHNEMREPWRSDPAARTCRATLLAAFDRLVGLLDDPDPGIRIKAVETLTELGERADDVADELTRRLPGEADPSVAAEAVLALGAIGASGAVTPGRRAVVAAWMSGRIPPPGDPRRLTFLVAARRLRHAAPTADTAPTAGELVAAFAYAVPERTVQWLGLQLGEDRDVRVALARVAIGQALRSGEEKPLAEVGTVMRMWRSATTVLAGELGAALGGEPVVRGAALHLLAASGETGRRWVEDVAALVGEGGHTGAMAVWALARWGDRRAVPAVVRSLRREPEIFRMGSAQYSGDFYWLGHGPGAAEVCGSLVAYADEIVPAVRWRLRNDSALPTGYQLTGVLSAYGAAGAAAVPELTALLDTEQPAMACTVLAGLGPAAMSARAKLTRLANSGRDGAVAAAWALFRITGDPQPLLRREDIFDAGRYSGAGARMLGDLGALAMRHAAELERQITERPEYWPTWEGVEAGFAHYRVTGDPGLCLDVFDAALDPLRHSRQLPVSRQVLRYLPKIGSVAARFAPRLRGAVEQDERLIYSGGWRGLSEDDEARDLASRALAAITP